MTTTSGSPALGATAWGTARLLAGTGRGRLDLRGHRAVHGPRHPYDTRRLVDALDAVHLLGRGGAAFPVAAKLRAVPTGRDTHVLANGTEGEPASHKDRVLLRLAPHLVIDGALTVARALGTDRVTITVQDPAAHHSLAAALRERDDGRPVRLVRHDHGFVGGEVRALTRALSGGPALPPGRRVLPTEHGIDGRPTFASNVETFAQIALLLSLGTDQYASVGATDEPGTTLLTLVGATRRPGVVEVPTGLPLAALVGPEPGPVLVGGYHGTWVDGPGDLVVTRPSLRAAEVPLNAGVLARLPRETCALGEVTMVVRWLAGESAGQCGPCLLGLPMLADTLAHLAAGAPLEADARARAGLLRGRGACGHPDGAASFVSSALDVLGTEIAAHRARGHCGRPLLGALPTGPDDDRTGAAA